MSPILQSIRAGLIAAGVFVAVIVFFGIAAAPMALSVMIDDLAASLLALAGGMVWLIAFTSAVGWFCYEHPKIAPYLPPFGLQMPVIPPPPPYSPQPLTGAHAGVHAKDGA